jgi:glycosyltransferase involved in cell wall biosynthesis
MQEPLVSPFPLHNAQLQPVKSDRISAQRVAFLFPSLELGDYWHPVFKRFTQVCPKLTIYTSLWQGYAPGFEDSFKLRLVGKYKTINWDQSSEVYQKYVAIVPLSIIKDLVRDRPQVIFTSAYSIWTLLISLLKPIFRWKIIVLYDGWSPTYDYSNSPIRLWTRRWMTKMADACVTNSPAGQRYLIDTLKAKASRVLLRPYQVPDPQALLGNQDKSAGSPPTVSIKDRPIRFLFVGRVTSRKGIKPLIQACAKLQAAGIENFQVTVIGDGDQRSELEALTNSGPLRDRVEWLGRIPYNQLGQYFQSTDVFLFPTLEDIWGMVLLEAMVFRKPVICSELAGAAESMVIENENGFMIDPRNVNDIAEKMRQFIEQPDRIAAMGQSAYETVAQYTPETATQFLLNTMEHVLK